MKKSAGRITLDLGNLFEQALKLFEEALGDYTNALSATPRYTQEQIREAQERYQRKRQAITNYVTVLEQERAAHLETLIKLHSSNTTPSRLHRMKEQAVSMRGEGDR